MDAHEIAGEVRRLSTDAAGVTELAALIHAVSALSVRMHECGRFVGLHAAVEALDRAHDALDAAGPADAQQPSLEAEARAHRLREDERRAPL